MTSLYESRLRSQEPPVLVREETPASESLIDRHSHFNGLYRSARDLRIEGSAEGEIECQGTVTVAEQARASAKIRARNVVIAGSANGEIVCQERFTLQPSGEMRGQVQAGSLVVEEGAFFEGQFQMAKDAAPPSPISPVKFEVTRNLRPGRRNDTGEKDGQPHTNSEDEG